MPWFWVSHEDQTTKPQSFATNIQLHCMEPWPRLILGLPLSSLHHFVVALCCFLLSPDEKTGWVVFLTGCFFFATCSPNVCKECTSNPISSNKLVQNTGSWSCPKKRAFAFWASLLGSMATAKIDGYPRLGTFLAHPHSWTHDGGWRSGLQEQTACCLGRDN